MKLIKIAKEVAWVASVLVAFGGFMFAVGGFVHQAKTDSDDVRAMKGDIAQIKGSVKTLKAQVALVLQTMPKTRKLQAQARRCTERDAYSSLDRKESYAAQ